MLLYFLGIQDDLVFVIFCLSCQILFNFVLEIIDKSL